MSGLSDPDFLRMTIWLCRPKVADVAGTGNDVRAGSSRSTESAGSSPRKANGSSVEYRLRLKGSSYS